MSNLKKKGRKKGRKEGRKGGREGGRKETKLIDTENSLVV